MDLGLFRRSRRVLMVWLIAPLFVILVLHYSVRLYCWSAGKELRTRSDIVKALPNAKKSLSTAGEAVSRYLLSPESRAEQSEELRLQINEIADTCGFTLNTLSIEESQQASEIGERTLLVSIKGEGTKTALTELFAQLEGPTSLLELQEARFRITKLIADPVFYGEMKCHYYDLGI